MYSELCSHHHNLILDNFQHPRKEIFYTLIVISIPLSIHSTTPAPATNLLSVSRDFPVLDISWSKLSSMLSFAFGERHQQLSYFFTIGFSWMWTLFCDFNSAFLWMLMVHLYVYLLAIWVCFWRKCLFKFFCPVLPRSFAFLLLSVIRVLHRFCISLWQIYDQKKFSPILWVFFSLLDNVLWSKKVLIFMKFYLFLLLLVFFGVISNKHCFQDHKDLLCLLVLTLDSVIYLELIFVHVMR